MGAVRHPPPAVVELCGYFPDSLLGANVGLVFVNISMSRDHAVKPGEDHSEPERGCSREGE